MENAITESMNNKRRQHLEQFYSLIDRIEQVLGSSRILAQCSGRLVWPVRGIYFFRETGEYRSNTGSGPRIVRVGTHALKVGSGTTLWNRLSQHKGQCVTGGGNHRGSIFRLIVGTALINRDGHQMPTWGKGSTSSRDVREREQKLEVAVSRAIGNMPFLWLPIEDDSGPNSLRGFIERNSIALLSNYNRPPIDPPSRDWLGHYCDRERVRNSGLWNSNHVNKEYDPAFPDVLERLVPIPGSLS